MSQNPSTILYLGVDVAKKHLDLDPTHLRRLTRVDNTPAGHRQLIKVLQALMAQQRTPHVVLEATGGYEQPLVEALLAADLRVSVVMPGRVRKYAQGVGRDAKTDQLDAAVLSAYGAHVQPQPAKPLTETERQLRELTRRRRQLLQMQTQELNRDLGAAANAHVRAGAAKLRALLKEQLTELDRALRALEKADAAYQAKVALLCTVKGVGRTTAAATLAALPELGTLNRAEAGSLAGLAPKNHDSGQRIGRRFIRGGRTEARRALYMAAVSAARCNPVLQPFYQRLRENGKAAKVALTAVMRRLLIHLNSLLKTLLVPSSPQPECPSSAPAA